MKALNVAAQHEFQVWGRRALPSSLVIQDVDGWLLLVSRPPAFEPSALLELKRSSVEPESWEPFAADRNNYAALLKLSQRARLPLLVVYFVKGRPLADSDPLGVFVMTEAVPAYRYAFRDVMPARAFALLFEHEAALARVTSNGGAS